MWTVAHKKCWTADRLARKGLSHPAVCPLCDQVEETIDHLLVSCVFSYQMWFNVLQGLGLHALAPGPDDLIFDDWWDNVSDRVSGQVQKGVNSVVILGAWNLWNQRNRCVFDGADPDLSNIISNTKEDLQQSVESETLAPKAQECWMGLHGLLEETPIAFSRH